MKVTKTRRKTYPDGLVSNEVIDKLIDKVFESVTDPYENIRAGVFVLRKLFERYQDTNMVLMAYNMGEDGAARLWDKGIYSTEYTEKIMNYQEQFNEQLGGE